MSQTTNDDVVERLKQLLANSYTLYLKTQNYHWNVRGPMFTTLHTLFEQQYTELALAVDEIAERIRALGARAPGSYSEFSQLSVIEEETGSPEATVMIANLATDLERVVEIAKQTVAAAESANDPASADLAIRRIDVHQKNVWMLRSHLE